MLDPLRRLALDAKLRLIAARKERTAGFDAKRKGLIDELEERERAFKKQKSERDQETRDRWKETERIKDENKRLMELRQQQQNASMNPKPVELTEDPNAPPEISQ